MKERSHESTMEVQPGMESSSVTGTASIPKEADPNQPESCLMKVYNEFFGKRFFLYMLVITISVAAAYPDAGRTGGPLAPEISVSWVAVVLIFFITGLKLKTQELSKAASYWKLNLYVLSFTYIFIPGTVFVLALLLRQTAFNSQLIDGLIVLSCLPTTISMCVILTKTGGGNEAAAVFNATVSNFLGIFITPSLVVLLLERSGAVSIEKIIMKLAVKVIAPIVFGQLLRYAFPGVQPFISRQGKNLKRFSEILLLFIVYCVFCNTFYNGVDAKPQEFAILLGILIPLHLTFLVVCFTTSRLPCLGYSRPDIVAVLFCSTEKTVALGIPLITAIYEGNDDIGILSVPLLIYHPMQLVIGSLFVGHLYEWATEGKSSSKGGSVLEGDDEAGTAKDSSGSGIDAKGEADGAMYRADSKSEVAIHV